MYVKGENVMLGHWLWKKEKEQRLKHNFGQPIIFMAKCVGVCHDTSKSEYCTWLIIITAWNFETDKLDKVYSGPLRHLIQCEIIWISHFISLNIPLYLFKAHVGTIKDLEFTILIYFLF